METWKIILFCNWNIHPIKDSSNSMIDPDESNNTNNPLRTIEVDIYDNETYGRGNTTPDMKTTNKKLIPGMSGKTT